MGKRHNDAIRGTLIYGLAAAELFFVFIGLGIVSLAVILSPFVLIYYFLAFLFA